MRIKEINWLDIGGEEAVLKVVSDTDCLVCFSFIRNSELQGNSPIQLI